MSISKLFKCPAILSKNLLKGSLTSKPLYYFKKRTELKKLYIWSKKLCNGQTLLKPGHTIRSVYIRTREYVREYDFSGEPEHILFVATFNNTLAIEKELKKALKCFPLNIGQHGNTEQYIFNDDTKAIIIKIISKYMLQANEFYIDDEYKTLINVSDNIHYRKEKIDRKVYKTISEQKFINTYDFYKLPKIPYVPKDKIRWTIIMRFKNQNGPFKNIDDFCNRMTNCSKIGQIIKKNVSLVLKETFKKLKSMLSQ